MAATHTVRISPDMLRLQLPGSDAYVLVTRYRARVGHKGNRSYCYSFHATLYPAVGQYQALTRSVGGFVTESFNTQADALQAGREALQGQK